VYLSGGPAAAYNHSEKSWYLAGIASYSIGINLMNL